MKIVSHECRSYCEICGRNLGPELITAKTEINELFSIREIHWKRIAELESQLSIAKELVKQLLCADGGVK